MGYPAAFTNVILKGAARGMIENPVGNVPKTLAAALIMTETARFANYARSRGESEQEGLGNVYARAITRWGGNGLYLDMFNRAQNTAEYIDPAFSIPAGITGPITQDTLRLVRQGNLFEFLGSKAPGYGAFNTLFGRDWTDNYRSTLRKWDQSLDEFVLGEEEEARFPFKKGGEVLDVPQVPEEPDERIDKMTGLPYDIQAGEAFVDAEDRDVRKE